MLPSYRLQTSFLFFVACLAATLYGQQNLVIDSPTLKAGAMMPRDYTPDGRNVSPPLTWTNVPAGTRGFAVVCEDFDAGNPPPFVHWVIYNIPGTAKGLPENVPIDPSIPMPAELAGAVQGLNGFKRAMYRGPAPPAGKPHRYHFVVSRARRGARPQAEPDAGGTARGNQRTHPRARRDRYGVRTEAIAAAMNTGPKRSGLRDVERA